MTNFTSPDESMLFEGQADGRTRNINELCWIAQNIASALDYLCEREIESYDIIVGNRFLKEAIHAGRNLLRITSDMANSSQRCIIVCMLLQVGVLTGRSEDTFVDINCPSPQYVLVGRTGRLDCSFPHIFAAVFWKYEQGDETSSLVGLEGTVKRGHGYENGKYDIHTNGSLIIKGVEVEDEGVYVVILVTSEEDVKHFRITLETTEYHRRPSSDFYCETPQYLQLGRAGQLHCKFPETFNAVIWKQERNGRQNTLVEKQNSLKNGQGFIYGFYDMHPNGSLIIHRVKATNDGVYDVTLVTTEDNVEHSNVTLITTVLSQQNHPYINLCGKDEHCSRRYDPDTPIYCSYSHSRPAVKLNWYIRYPNWDTLLQTPFNYEPDSNKTFSSISRFNIEDLTAGSFMFLVCVASGPPLTTHIKESWLILDTSQDIYEILNSVSISKMDVPLYGNSVLSCGPKQPLDEAVIWLSVDLTGLTSTLVYSMYHTPQRRYYIYSTVHFDETCTEIDLFRVTREDENIYVCLSTNGTHTAVMTAFQLAVYVTPIPPFIKVDACLNGTADCQLSSREGNVTFCISRVFNNIELATYTTDNSKISTSNEKQSRQSTGGGFFHHCVTFDYKLHQDVCDYPVRLLCLARTKGGLEIVPGKKITFMNQKKCQSDIPSFHPVVTFSTLGVFAAVIVVLVIIIVYLCKTNRRTN